MNIEIDPRGATRTRTRAVRRPAERSHAAGVTVLKFGGSSLATPDRIVQVGRIIVNATGAGPAVVVVSAFEGVTNQLLECAHLAAQPDGAHDRLYDAIAARHREAIDALLAGEAALQTHARVHEPLGDLRRVLRGIRHAGVPSPAALDEAASVGERLSAIVVSAYVNRYRPARFVDARLFVTTDDQFTRARVMLAKTNRDAQAYFSSLWRSSRAIVPVVTGFIARTPDGRTTTVGRNGSDYTASILGGALDASSIEIWTDVDGVLSADPKQVASAVVLPQMTYDEALEMARCGAKVLHADAIGPAVSRSIPIVVKNSFNPSAPGTRISRSAAVGQRRATGVSGGDDVTLITLGWSTGGALARAERLCRALAGAGAEAAFLSQVSSSRTISAAVPAREATMAAEAVAQEFRHDIREGAVTLEQTPDQSVIAVIGDGLQQRSDVAGLVLGSLARHDIGVRAIAHGGSRRSLSFVVDRSERQRALDVVHRACFGPRTSLALVVVGVGKVGGALLRQLHERRTYLGGEGFDVSVVAIADSRRFVVSREGIDLARWREALDASPQAMDPDALTRAIADLRLAHTALIDCTADPSIVDAYAGFIAANLHIVTPNKRANVLPWPRYTVLTGLLAAHQRHFLYETNVGAGLPVMSTLRNLIASGDVMTKVEGILSGTLGYLFNTFDGTAPFSVLVRDAHRRGYTEPDPRDDLSGRDVARKLLILARHTGLRMEIDDVSVDSLVPESLAGGPFSDDFFSAYAAHDGELRERFERAKARGAVLRYVGTLEGGRAAAGIREFPRDHPFAATRGSDNVVAFTGTRCGETPVIVQGPGAGAEVTAMGVFADILRLLHYLPR